MLVGPMVAVLGAFGGFAAAMPAMEHRGFTGAIARRYLLCLRVEMDRALQRKDEVRLRLLQYFYRVTGGRGNCSITFDDEVTESVGATLDEVVDAAEFLSGEGLLKSKSISGIVYSITHAGAVEAEESIRNPDRETEHFSQVVVHNVTNNFGNGNVIGSIQSGGTGNTATVNQTVTNNAKQVIQELRDKVASLPPEQHEEVHSVIDQIEAMVEKGPKALKAIELLITGLVTYFPGAVPWLTSQAQLIAHAFGA